MKTIERCAAALAVVLLLAGCAGAHYEPPKPRFAQDPGGRVFEPKMPWKEGDAQLPAYPKPADLQEFQISGTTDNRYFIDASSLRVDADGVVRYSLVVRSKTGVENVSFEGMRCDAKEWKAYAFGRPDGTWSADPNAQWQPIVWRSSNGYRFELFSDYFCPDGFPPRDAKAALAALRR